ncbi:MAG: AAA-like domain-containing protein [Acetobacteraceae bacterium]|nr:AAA-like domain-containing protein [Acetobacteraceae bacterium]
MGIHSGLVQWQLDISGNENVVGEGINTAQRVMDFGEAGHILLSAQYANWLQQFDEWAPRVSPLGEGVAKHGLKVQVYTLSAADFGRVEPPTRLNTSPAKPARDAAPAPSGASGKVVLLYRRHSQPDENVLHTLEERLKEGGHEVFVDHHRNIGVEWAQSVEERIRAADAVVAIVSPKAMQCEMLEFEIETACDQHQKTGKPAILPIRIGTIDEEGGRIAVLLAPLKHFEWRDPEDDHRLVAELLSAIAEPLRPRALDVKLEPVGGAVPPGSPYYVERSCDIEFLQALDNQESIILIKGARQIGKTSLEARGAAHAAAQGWRCCVTDYQKLNSAQMASDDAFYKLLAATLARQLKFPYDFKSEWTDLFGSNLNMENFLRELLDSREEPLLWLMDEVDKLFAAPFASDFFGLVRSWHNSRSTEPGGPWSKLTVVIAYATEAHLFIQDLNQSPFNVGRRIELEDFNVQQVVDLNGRYGGPLKAYREAEELHTLLGGQPYLTRRALDVLATGKLDFAGLREHADRDDGPFGDHLKRLLLSVSRLPEVLEYVRSLLEGRPGQNQDAYYRLLAGGIIQHDSSGRLDFRCNVYRTYLRNHLLTLS